MIRLQVQLEPGEAEQLARWAAQELREPGEQLRYLLRREFEEQEAAGRQPVYEAHDRHTARVTRGSGAR